MRRILGAVLTLALSLGIAGANANPIIVLRGSAPSGAGSGSGTAYAVDPNGTGVRADFSSGQAFVTWPDALSGGFSDYTKRYRLYRSTAALTSGNCASAAKIASYILPNSGQLFGGSPDISLGRPFTQANRQANTGLDATATQANNPMSKLPDMQLGGTRTLSYNTGAQVYTATGSGDAYYCVMQTDTSDGTPVYIGSVGPIAESVADPSPVQYATSGSRVDNSYGTLTSTAGGCLVASCPAVFRAHQSESNGGAPAYSQFGDYLDWHFTKAEGWQDGRETTWAVHQDNAQHFPSLAHSIELTNRDTIWNGLGTGGMETYHSGVGLSPNPLVGLPNKMYPITARGIARMMNWSITHYNLDPNQLHWTGESMGAWGGANTGMRMTAPDPQFSAVWLSMPIWRKDRRGCITWPGGGWSSTDPFRATVTTVNSCYLGSTASSVQMDDGTTWGGTGGIADQPTFIASNPGNDIPVAIWMASKDDLYPASFLEQIEAMDAFESAHRGYASCWFMGEHDTNFFARSLIDRDWPSADTSIAYPKTKFKLNAAYLAFANSSINDNPGTSTRQANGIYDGDHNGCRNAGFTWNFTNDASGNVAFTVGNGYMNRAPTAEPTATLSSNIPSSGLGTFTVVDPSALQPTASNPYFFVDNEALSATLSGSTLTIVKRGIFGTTAGIAAHNAPAVITQFLSKPTGPNIGAQTTMTVDIALRRLQNYHPLTGTVPCTYTPSGGSATPVTANVVSGIPVLTGVVINSTGATGVSCI